MGFVKSTCKKMINNVSVGRTVLFYGNKNEAHSKLLPKSNVSPAMVIDKAKDSITLNVHTVVKETPIVMVSKVFHKSEVEKENQSYWDFMPEI